MNYSKSNNIEYSQICSEDILFKNLLIFHPLIFVLSFCAFFLSRSIRTILYFLDVLLVMENVYSTPLPAYDYPPLLL